MNKIFFSLINFLTPAILFAQEISDADTTNAETAKAPGIESLLFQLLIIFLIFYFLLIKPQAKKAKMHQALVASLKKGDEVLTNGGIYGKVSKSKEGEKTIEIEIAENVSIKIARSSVQEILNLTEENKEATKEKSVKDKKKK
ncbi:MAG: preprotein translocase subunit YajC [Rickettsiales bacterium]|nr:preprotein translocase subunit YajC [Rickettsiales bacterium]